MRGRTEGIAAVLTMAFVLALLLGSPASVPAQAFSEQVSRKVTEDLNLTREVIQLKRKAIVALNLDLTDYESKAFWPVYEEYWAEMKKLGDRNVALISDFAKHYVYESLTNEKAEEMIKEWMSIKQQEIKLKQKYVKRFKKVIPEKKVLRYFQIENKLDLIVNTEVSAQIPLAR
jgi:hypothetical protein